MTFHSTPGGAPIPCWARSYFRGMVYGGTAALCCTPGCSRVRSAPKDGCSAWQRLPGSDDEPGPPVAHDVVPVLPGLPIGPHAVEWAP